MKLKKIKTRKQVLDQIQTEVWNQGQVLFNSLNQAQNQLQIKNWYKIRSRILNMVRNIYEA